ncbi:MAG: formate acetyltransferase [Ruminococcaceae bacterium]|nr:formate acetyltransferase [Oscillospiraceae bacterium]
MLTYKDRINLMREKKINDTIIKKEQQGMMDIDDFGTVPVPDGYKVTPFYNSTNGSFYGLDGMSENFCRVLKAHVPYVDPMEMICGRWMDMLVNYRGDKHYAPKWQEKDETLSKLTEEEKKDVGSKRWDETRFPYDDLKPYQKKYNITSGIDGDAHLACDYSIGFELGFGGFLDKINHYRKINPQNEEFYAAEEKCVNAIIDYIDRCIERIKELIKCEERPEIKENLCEMLKVNENIRLNPPKTFHEVIQWTAHFNMASRIYTRDGAGFQLDTLLYPYYENDIKNGILDDEKAKFLIANLFLTDPHYYQLSGVDADDNDLTNHLSYLALEAADMINIACNLTVRVHENCDKKFLQRCVYYLIKNKNGWPRFCSDKNLCEGYMKNGYSKEIARKRIAVGCNWMCIPGMEFPMNDTVKINVAKVMEQALIDMKEEGERSSQRLFELYEKHLIKAIEIVAKGVNLHIEHQHQVTPELIMNLMMHDTIEKGLDISQCAKIYTVGVDGAGLAVVADSFGAIETRIEKENKLSWDDLYTALENNFSDERIRLMMQTAPRYCQGGTVSDEWAKKLTESFSRHVKSQEMPDGRQLVPGWFSWARTLEYGKEVGATPNGRRNAEPISHGANPNPHFRTDGAVSAQANGIASIQCGYGNTAPLQIEFDPKVVADEKGVELITSFIITHFELGGTLININILDGKKLIEAHNDPTLYPDLVVRVTGFTAYFSTLSKEFRQLVVDRFLEGI